jgi:hypothetical protein
MNPRNPLPLPEGTNPFKQVIVSWLPECLFCFLIVDRRLGIPFFP